MLELHRWTCYCTSFALPTFWLYTFCQSILCQLHYVLCTPYARPAYVYLLQVFHPCTTPYVPSGGAPMLCMTSTYTGPSGGVPWRYVHFSTTNCYIFKLLWFFSKSPFFHILFLTHWNSTLGYIYLSIHLHPCSHIISFPYDTDTKKLFINN